MEELNNLQEQKVVDKNSIIKEKIFRYSSLVLLVISFIYFTVYGFLENPFYQAERLVKSD